MSLILPDTPVLTGNTDQKLFVIRSYLCELSERLQLALWNMGEDSLSPGLQQKLNQIAADAKAAGEKIVSREEAAQKEFKTLMDRIVETAESVTLSFETSLQEQEDRIVSQVQETYAARSELGELEEHLSSSITQTAEDLTATFTQIASVTAREEVENQSINAYFRFSADGLLIGRTVETEIDGEVVESMPFAARLASDRLSFLDGGAEVAYISQNRLYITEAQVTGKMTYGYEALGRYAMQVRENGNFGLGWLREESE